MVLLVLRVIVELMASIGRYLSSIRKVDGSCEFELFGDVNGRGKLTVVEGRYLHFMEWLRGNADGVEI